MIIIGFRSAYLIDFNRLFLHGSLKVLLQKFFIDCLPHPAMSISIKSGEDQTTSLAGSIILGS